MAGQMASVLGLSYLDPPQAQKAPTHVEALLPAPRALIHLMKGSWALIGKRCVLPWSPPECGFFANLEETVPDAPAAPGQSLHAPPFHPHSAHLRRTCPGRVQRRRKERVAGTRVVIPRGPWSPFSAWLPRREGISCGSAESTEPSSHLASSQGACGARLGVVLSLSILCSLFLCPAVTSQGPELFSRK